MSVPNRILRFKEVQSRIGGYSRMHVDRLEKAGKFPSRVQIGSNSVGWMEDDIAAWIGARTRGSHAPVIPDVTESPDNTATPPKPARKRGRPPGPAHPAP
ncbi:helix-turn-helix transcriptional regulator [Azospirillum doebereinerae]|uniref:AlpA family phage regulatory protein n=1 Tax=Azospirillum doebereinerae TaxID=92933 RepID=A0A433IZS2_9PROT|nr:AlpA family phage regulatory protein [Azospirillum doebereinerae]RUQ61249.1 AlpA family phage regulatory protein [Azospirillum doebereinerae]